MESWTNISSAVILWFGL